MEFMTVKDVAAKWGLSERRLQTICNEGKISGVIMGCFGGCAEAS